MKVKLAKSDDRVVQHQYGTVNPVMELVEMCRERLFNNFYEWIEKNRDTLDKKWVKFLYREGKKAEGTANTTVGVISVAMWMHNILANFGVLAVICTYDYVLKYISPQIDEHTTRRLLQSISSCMILQFLPREEL